MIKRGTVEHKDGLTFAQSFVVNVDIIELALHPEPSVDNLKLPNDLRIHVARDRQREMGGKSG